VCSVISRRRSSEIAESHLPRRDVAVRLGKPLILASLLFAACLLLYLPSVRFGFTLDDPLLTTKNSTVSGFSGDYLRFFRASLYDGARQEAGNSNLYRPVLKSSIAFNRALANGKFDPAPYHWFNIILYAMCVSVVFVFLQRLFRSTRYGGFGFAFLVSLLFCVFPSHLETVCNVKHREEILACLFGLSAWSLALRNPGEDDRRSILSVLAPPLLFLLALLSKESAILLFPCMILWEFRASGSSSALIRRIPTHLYTIPIAVLVYFLLRFYALGSLTSPPGTRMFFGGDTSVLARTLISSRTFVEYYLWDQLVSLRLDPAFSSPFVVTTEGRPTWIDSVALCLLVGALLLSLRWLLTRRSVFAFWVLFVIVTSFLTLNVVPIGSAGAFRFMFTPSVGLCVLIALFLHGIIDATGAFFAVSPLFRERAFLVGMGLLVAFYAHATYAKMGIWQDDGRLFAYSASLEPANPLSPFAAGQYYARVGSDRAKWDFYERSLERFLAFRGRPGLFDERSIDSFSVVATEIAHREVSSNPLRSIELADVAIEQFERLVEMRKGRVDSNATAPYFVKALALQRIGRIEESMAACEAGLAISHHEGLARLLLSLRSSRP
jgi:hypothetical protein